MTKAFLFSLLLLISVAFTCEAMESAVTAVADLRYGSQSAIESGVKVLDASHFIQHYSFLYEVKGSLAKGRAGKYDFSLGYEQNYVDSEINGVAMPIDNPLDKILYRGNILLAPGGLPFRLNMYSHDMQRVTSEYKDLGALFEAGAAFDAGSEFGTVTEVTNGERTVSGLTLEFGVSNGSYGGPYRDILTSVPRFLLDYRESYAHDVHTTTPEHWRDRDLAFVSLNKKSNWYHYRVATHEDLLNPLNNSTTSSHLLGTIDHLDHRQWVQLTNWIKVSADLSYSEGNSPGRYTNAQSVAGSKYERHSLNLFTRAERTRWRVSSYSNYNRLRTPGVLTKELSVPIFASGEIDANTSWRSSLVANRFLENDSSLGDKLDSLSGAVKVEMYKQARYIVVPSLEGAVETDLDGRGLAVRAGVELYSNAGYRSSVDLAISYSASLFSKTANNGQTVDAVESAVNLAVEKELSSVARLGWHQELVYGTGDSVGSVTDAISPLLAIRSAGDSGSAFRSGSDLYVEYRPSSKWADRISASHGYSSSILADETSLGLAHSLDYYGKKMTGRMTNAWHTNPIVETGSDMQAIKAQFTNTFQIRYSSGRAVKANIKLNYDVDQFENGATTTFLSAAQGMYYTFFSQAGARRPLVRLAEEVTGTRSPGIVGDSANSVGLLLGCDYFPTRKTLLGIKARYDIDNYENSDTVQVFLTAGMNFKKLSVTLDYAYAERSETSVLPGRMEHRWEARVKKTF